MDKTVIKKYKLGEEPKDSSYWQQQSYEKRLEALEAIRAEYIQWRYGADPGFQRVYRIVKQT